MEIQIKKAVRAGNSSAVILPRAWLNKEIRVELVKKSNEMILIDVIEILNKYINLEDIIGIYLTGSYARGEEEQKSDIDILVITDDIDREMISDGIYNVFVISSELLKQKLKSDILPVGQMIKEAKALINSGYLESIEIKATKENVKWYINTTEDKLKIIKKAINNYRKKNKKHISDLVAYTMILRIRTLYIIKNLIKNKIYSKKEFIRLIRKISGSMNAYNGYLAVKNDEEDKYRTEIGEAERLYNYLKDKLMDIKAIKFDAN